MVISPIKDFPLHHRADRTPTLGPTNVGVREFAGLLLADHYP
jgi:hypothetical protein